MKTEFLWCPVCSPTNVREMKLQEFEIGLYDTPLLDRTATCQHCGMVGMLSILRQQTTLLWKKPMPRSAGVEPKTERSGS